MAGPRLLGRLAANTISIVAVGARVSVPWPVLGALLVVAACEGPEATETSEVATATHALLRVERSALVGAEDEATGMAFAGVLRMPLSADPEPLLRLSGRGLSLPALGACLAVSRERAPVVVSDVGRAEFLEAGDVTLRASQTETLLAPRLFESSQTELSGVAYSSRDRASEPVPGGAAYVLKTTGSDQLPALELRVQAPEVLSDVAIGGVGLGEVTQVAVASELQVSWRPGDARDVVYVEVTGSTEAGTLGVCAFRDSDGRGLLPSGLFGAVGAGSLAFHRLRGVAADVTALDAAEARFDFELTAEVSFR
jgi:hypothetical protein